MNERENQVLFLSGTSVNTAISVITSLIFLTSILQRFETLVNERVFMIIAGTKLLNNIAPLKRGQKEYRFRDHRDDSFAKVKNARSVSALVVRASHAHDQFHKSTYQLNLLGCM